MEGCERRRSGPGHRAAVAVTAVLLLLSLFLLTLASCANEGNATAVEREVLLRAVRGYWEADRDYSLGSTSGVGDLTYADVQSDEAEVQVEIILGYTQPTEGAGYKETTFRLRRENGVWKVTYDGWVDRELD